MSLSSSQDWQEEYETAKDYIKDKFEENPDLTESDTRLMIAVIEDATGIVIPIDEDDIPAVGTVTRASRELRREEGYEGVASDEVTQERDNKEEQMKEMHGKKKSDNQIFP